MSSLSNYYSSESLSVPFELRREHISFRKENMISDGLLDISSAGGILRVRPFFELASALAQTPVFPVGDAPALSLCLVDDQLRIMFSLAHLRFVPDDNSLNFEEQYLVAATSPRSDQAILISLPQQLAPQLYLDGFDVKLLTKLRDDEVIANLERMSIASTTQNNSLPVQNCVAVPLALFKFLLSQDASAPLDCLLAVLHWLYQQNLSSFIPTTGGDRIRKPLSPSLRDLLAFLVLSCKVPDNLKSAACTTFELFPIGEVYSKSRDRVLKWTTAVEEEDPVGERETNGIPVNVHVEQPPPLTVQNVPGQEMEAADRLSRPQELQQPQQTQQVQQPQQSQQPQQGSITTNDLLVSFLENMSGMKTKSSSSFFELRRLDSCKGNFPQVDCRTRVCTSRLLGDPEIPDSR